CVAQGARAEDEAPSLTLADGPPKKEQDDTEFTAVPVIGGDSDVGLGVGYVASFAVVRPGVNPYVWRLESGGALTARFSTGEPRLGYFDQYLMLVVPYALR